MTSLCVLHDGDERPEAVPGLLLCRKHRRRMDDDVTEIGLLIVDSQRVTDGGVPSDPTPKTRRLKQPEAPAPGDLLLMAMYDPRTTATRLRPTPEALAVGDKDGDQSEPLTNVLGEIADLVERLAEERRLSNLPASVLAQLDLLKRHHDWIAAQDWCDEYLEQIATTKRGLAGALHDHRFIPRDKPCNLPAENGEGTCGGKLLEENGTAVVVCVKCRARWVTGQELARLALSLESA